MDADILLISRDVEADCLSIRMKPIGGVPGRQVPWVNEGPAEAEDRNRIRRISLDER
jgi:hypothetical protein